MFGGKATATGPLREKARLLPCNVLLSQKQHLTSSITCQMLLYASYPSRMAAESCSISSMRPIPFSAEKGIGRMELIEQLSAAIREG